MRILRKLVYAVGVVFSVILVLVAILAISDALFKVKPHQIAIVLEFGKPIRTVPPGLHVKVPFTQSVYYCDIRVQELNVPDVEAQMSDLTRISVDATVNYRIVDCLSFLMNAGSSEGFHEEFGRLLISTLREILIRFSLTDLSDKRHEILGDVKAQMTPIAQRFGSGLIDVNLFFSKMQTAMDADAYMERGRSWAMKGDYDRAISDYNKAIQIDPRNAYAYMVRATAWEEKGDFDHAVTDFSKALEIEPRNAEAYYWRGRTWDKKGAYNRAIADFNKALEIQPRHVNAYNVLAWILATCPDPRYRDGVKAVQLAQKAVERQPQYYGFLDTLAAAYAEAGKFEDAITTQEKAIALLPREAKTEESTEFMERLTTYKEHKPWREK